MVRHASAFVPGRQKTQSLFLILSKAPSKIHSFFLQIGLIFNLEPEATLWLICSSATESQR
jgi:hypothetical protein